MSAERVPNFDVQPFTSEKRHGRKVSNAQLLESINIEIQKKISFIFAHFFTYIFFLLYLKGIVKPYADFRIRIRNTEIKNTF